MTTTPRATAQIDVEQLRKLCNEMIACDGKIHANPAELLALLDRLEAAERATPQPAPAQGVSDAEDAARLDFIEKNARSEPKMDGQNVWWPTTFNQALRGPTLREAIDAAMKKATP